MTLPLDAPDALGSAAANLPGAGLNSTVWTL